ncbi:MAG: RDD family protein [Pseudomonadota bacterium]
MTDTKPQTRRQRRAARRAEREAAAARVMPPEGVPLRLPIAGVGVRLGAQITDILITGVAAIALVILLSMLDITGPNTLSAIAALIFFTIRVPYYVMAELAWNGQTLGKKFMKIKVVAHDGGPLTTHALVLRNIMKEAEVFLPGTLILTLTQANPIASWISLAWVTMALIIPLTNPHRMRLGDMLAGTHVVFLPVPILLKDLAQAPVQATYAKKERFPFLQHHLEHYGRFELQTLEAYLRAQGRANSATMAKRNRETAATIVDRIRKKIDYAEVIDEKDHVSFLQAFYKAQRAHLEQRQLFGDRRDDKHHAAAQD